jgi:hypothetical protein
MFLHAERNRGVEFRVEVRIYQKYGGENHAAYPGSESEWCGWFQT